VPRTPAEHPPRPQDIASQESERAGRLPGRDRAEIPPVEPSLSSTRGDDRRSRICESLAVGE